MTQLSIKIYFEFSDPIDFGQHVGHPINLLHFNCNYNKHSRRFDKAHRKRSCRKYSYRNNSLHPSHHPIDLSSRSGVLDGEIYLLSKGPSFCPTPSDINWYKCHLDCQAFVDRLRWADFFLDRNESNTVDTPGYSHEELGPFSIKSNKRAPVSKDIAPETFVATIENKLFDIKRARTRPINNLSKLERSAMNQLHSSNDTSVRLHDKGSRFVILDRQDYIDKVESNLNDGSFDVLPSDPSIIFTKTIKNWGEKWIKKGEIAEPLLDCILNSKAKPGTNYGLIKTHKPGNTIQLITSGIGTAVENLSAFTEYFLYSCVKEPQILLDTTALLNKIEDINHKFSPFPEGTLPVSWDVISMYPSINNEMGISACKRALDKRTTLSPSTECLLEAVKIMLDCNNSFNNKHYRQNRGTAMGPHNACSYADLAMIEIDHKILNHYDRPKDLVFSPDWS